MNVHANRLREATNLPLEDVCWLYVSQYATELRNVFRSGEDCLKQVNDLLKAIDQAQYVLRLVKNLGEERTLQILDKQNMSEWALALAGDCSWLAI